MDSNYQLVYPEGATHLDGIPKVVVMMVMMMIMVMMLVIMDPQGGARLHPPPLGQLPTATSPHRQCCRHRLLLPLVPQLLRQRIGHLCLPQGKNGLILPTGQWYAPSPVINDAWYCIVLHVIAWYCIVLHGIPWYCMVLHGITWYYMVVHGIAWYCMVLHDNA